MWRARVKDLHRVVQSRTGSDGTCFRACLASILDLNENQVPDFTDDGFFEQADKFLAQYGLKYRRRPITGAKPVGYSTIEGISPRGGLHACVALDGELVWDPHPIEMGDGQGLVESRYYGVLEKVGKGRDAQADEDARAVAQVFKSGGKSAAVSKANEFANGQPTWVARALFDKALMILVPGGDKESRLKRNEILRTGRVEDTTKPKCDICGKKLPPNAPFTKCEACMEKWLDE